MLNWELKDEQFQKITAAYKLMDMNVTSDYNFNRIFFHEKTEINTLLIGIAVEQPVTHKSQFGHLLACAAALLPPTL